MKIVDSGYKIDLHIHSVYSRGKDKDKVRFNTIHQIPVLAEKLNSNEVQICAITDHDVFNYEMYCELKKYELKEESSIIKVLPGVEFSVEFQGGNNGTVVHVIAIFNDEDDDKVKLISSYLVDANGNPKYDKLQSFTEEKFLYILREIDLDTILIAHQKSTLSSEHSYKNDAKKVGEERFSEFIFTDYFEAFEFKNRRNEVFNKNYLNTYNMRDNIRFITGSDCHDWRYYPKETEGDQTDFIYSYVKCIPNFRGLVMAITDHRRIKRVNSFFNPAQIYTKVIEMSVDGVEYEIPLSKGINVIIGDNSIGKSLLLHKLTKFKKYEDGLIKKDLVDGYRRYLKKNNIDIKTEIPESEIFAFDMQGEIRDKFEQEKLKSDDFLRQYYPAAIKPDAYMEKIQRKLDKLYGYLEEKFALDIMETQLGIFKILDENDIQAESLIFIGTVAKNIKKVEGYNGIINDLENVIEKLETIKGNEWLEKDSKSQLDQITNQLKVISECYSVKVRETEQENMKVALFQAAVASYKQKYQSIISDSQKQLSTFNENVNKAKENIVELISRRRKNHIPDFDIENEVIEIHTERVHDYEFNSRLGITEINSEYIKGLFSSVMRKNVKKKVTEMSQKELVDSFSGYTGSPAGVLTALKDSVASKMNNDFMNKFTITQAGMDRTQELSSGFNSKIYFDIISYETRHNGVYIIDQPEDNVSQNSIREYLLDRFKIMGEHRQVIIVTHNPQFIVNLDVDNVIYIGMDKGEFFVKSGALEYKDDDYSILDIISNHIEGGLDTLRRRWKRYEKNTRV